MSITGGIFPGGSTDPFKGASGTTPGKTGAVPAPDPGEQNYFLRGDGEWAPADGSGGGDVVGPGSSVDNRIVRFDGATGKVIQNSVVTLDDVGNMSGLASVQTLAVACDANDLTIGTIGTGDIIISSPDSVIIQGIVYPNIDGLNGQVLATDGSGNLAFVNVAAGFSPANAIYVAKNGNDASGTGEIGNPYETIQKAIDSALSGQVIFIYPGTYEENLVLNSKNSITLQGITFTKKGQKTVIQGEVSLTNASRNLGFVNLEFAGSTLDVPTIYDDSTLGRHYFLNTVITHTDINLAALTITNSRDFLLFDSCEISSLEISGDSVSAHPITIVNSSVGTYHQDNIDASVSMMNCKKIGPISHLAGVLSLDNIGKVVADSLGVAIFSSCTASEGSLQLRNVSLLQENASFGKLDKVGNCTYSFTQVARDIANDTIIGIRQNYMSHAIDIDGDYAPINYVIDDNSVSAHLKGIDEALVSSGTIWNIVTENTNMVPGNNYITDDIAKIDLTLPANCTIGAIFEIGGFGNGGWEIKQGAGQQIHFGKLTTTRGVTGSIASTDAKDSIKIVCVREDTDFLVLSSVGNLNLI